MWSSMYVFCRSCTLDTHVTGSGTGPRLTTNQMGKRNHAGTALARLHGRAGQGSDRASHHETTDAVVKVTGTAVLGSDLHLHHNIDHVRERLALTKSDKVGADYAAMMKQFLIRALTDEGVTERCTGQAPAQEYSKDLAADRGGKFGAMLILVHRFEIDKFSEPYEAVDRKEASTVKTFVQTHCSRAASQGHAGTAQLQGRRS